MLLALNHSTERAAVVYLPAHTAVEIPGRGLLAVGDAFLSGGAPLLLMSAENLLGVPLDHHEVVSAQSAQKLFGLLGPLQVDVPGEVRSAGGAGELLFSPGSQRLEARWLTRLLFTSGAGRDDIELGPRHLAVWKSMLGRFRALGDRVRPSMLEGALSGADASGQVRLLSGIAAVGRDDLTLASLPVSQLGAGDDELYSLDSEALTELLERALGAPDLEDDKVLVQVPNGNGAPAWGPRSPGGWSAKATGSPCRAMLRGSITGGRSSWPTIARCGAGDRLRGRGGCWAPGRFRWRHSRRVSLT